MCKTNSICEAQEMLRRYCLQITFIYTQAGEALLPKALPVMKQ